MSPRRRITALAMRLGVFGFFLVAAAVSVASFALFGCFCPPQASQRSTNRDGLIVNPPDPPGSGTPLLK